MPRKRQKGAAAPFATLQDCNNVTIRDFVCTFCPLLPANLVNSNAVRCVRRRGNLNNGANDGFRYFNANNAPSTANWNYGAQLFTFSGRGQPAAAILLLISSSTQLSEVWQQTEIIRLERPSKSLKRRKDKKDMKRFGHLWENFFDIETAKQAIVLGTVNKRHNHAIQRKLCYRTDNPQLKYKLDPNRVQAYAEKVMEELRNGWRHKPMREKEIHPPRGKTRKIDSPCLEDHIVHWMLILAIKKPLTRGMYEHSYGSIPKRGISGTRKAAERWPKTDKESKYFVKLDIKKFYPNVDQEILRKKFRDVIKDEKMLGVIDEAISCIPKGLPIGTYTSQWFANFYLQDMDHYIVQDLYKTRRGKRIPFVRHYLRYMDDMLLIGASKRDLEKAVRAIQEYCRTELHLNIKPAWEIRRIAECRRNAQGHKIPQTGCAPVDIVGYRFYRNCTEVRKGLFLHMNRLVSKVEKSIHHKRKILLLHAEGIMSLAGWFRHAECKIHLLRLNMRVHWKHIRNAVSYASKHGIGDVNTWIPVESGGCA